MASQVLSGASNASYTNNTGQNVRLIINYMSNVTSMTWAGVTVTASSTTIGKDIQNITGELRSFSVKNGPTSTQNGSGASIVNFSSGTYDVDISQKLDSVKVVRSEQNRTNLVLDAITSLNTSPSGAFYGWLPTPVYVPTTISRGGDFPTELMLANGQSFSSVCGAYNAIVIKEDGT